MWEQISQMFAGMKSSNYGAGSVGPGGVGPTKPAPWWQKGMQQIGAYQQQGGQGIPVLSPISQGLQQHDMLERQGRVLHTQMQLETRASRAAQRDTIGKQITGTAAAGLTETGSTVDLMNQTNLEYELDQAILKHSYKLQREEMDRAGDAARIRGFVGGASDIGKMFMGGF